jgi:hypothetical protein
MTTTDVNYVTVLDPGPAQEFTAIAVLERTRMPVPGESDRRENHYAVRHLERLPPGTPFPEIGALLAKRFGDAPLAGTNSAKDITAGGKPVLDLLRRARIPAYLRPITVTAAHESANDGKGGWLAPRIELVSTTQILLQSRRLKVAQGLPETPMLVHELLKFKEKPPAASGDTSEAGRGGRTMIWFWPSPSRRGSGSGRCGGCGQRDERCVMLRGDWPDGLRIRK